jgi:ribosomal protein S27E
MTLKCPTCGSFLFPVVAGFGGVSACKHCGDQFTSPLKGKAITVTMILVGLGWARFADKLLSNYFRPETAFLIVLPLIIVLGTALIPLTKIAERSQRNSESDD